jgi:TnpA family transposase
LGGNIRSEITGQLRRNALLSHLACQRSHVGLNNGEASNTLRRAMFFHRQGELRDRTSVNQELLRPA